MAEKKPNPPPTTAPPAAPPAPPQAAVAQVLREIQPAIEQIDITKKTAPAPAPMPFSPPKSAPRKAIKTKPPRTAHLTKEQKRGLPPSAKQRAEAERAAAAKAKLGQ